MTTSATPPSTVTVTSRASIIGGSMMIPSRSSSSQTHFSTNGQKRPPRLLYLIYPSTMRLTDLPSKNCLLSSSSEQLHTCLCMITSNLRSATNISPGSSSTTGCITFQNTTSIGSVRMGSGLTIFAATSSSVTRIGLGCTRSRVGKYARRKKSKSKAGFSLGAS